MWVKGKVNQSRYRPEEPRGFQEVKFPRLRDNGPECLQGCQPYATATFTHTKYSWYTFLLEAELTPGLSAIGRIMSMKNSNDMIWNRISDLPICSTAP